MRIESDKKLSIIADIWNSYFLNYRFCQSKIKYTKDVQSNYFGDILRYFDDTFPMLYSKSKTKSFTRNMERAISFLQIIYTQQDMLEELLHIFRCDGVIGKLKKDNNYLMNRILRNELIGHPVRKKVFGGKNELLSSTIFSNSLTSDNIAYILYHRGDDYKFKHKIVSRRDILQRHEALLKCYLDVIIDKIREILKQFFKKLKEAKKVTKAAPFENLIKFVGSNFEYIYESNQLYKQEILLDAFKLKHKHKRYALAIETFLSDLDVYIEETTIEINNFLIDKHPIYSSKKNKVKIKVAFTDESIELPEKKTMRSFHYELSKLSDKKITHNFYLASSLLKSKCSDNKIILEELKNMEGNLENDLEYYCSYNLIKLFLKEK